MIIWIIGLSGSGKTTLGKYLCAEIRKKGKAVVMLDGDEIRDLFANDLSHSLEDREKNADRIYNLGQFIASQGITVICPILSVFTKHRKMNRESTNKYYEIFIETPMDILERRDSKGIYEKYKKGEIKNVAGKDLEFPIPTNPNLKIVNNGKIDELFSSANIVLNYL